MSLRLLQPVAAAGALSRHAPPQAWPAPVCAGWRPETPLAWAVPGPRSRWPAPHHSTPQAHHHCSTPDTAAQETVKHLDDGAADINHSWGHPCRSSLQTTVKKPKGPASNEVMHRPVQRHNGQVVQPGPCCLRMDSGQDRCCLDATLPALPTHPRTTQPPNHLRS